MNASDAAWFHFWEGLATFGFLLVIAGCVIEGVEHFIKFKRSESAKKLQWEKIGWFILIGGLAIEFIAENRAKRMADRENARLTLEAAQAHETAGEANKRAALVESNNLVLRSNVVELELKTMPKNQPWLNTVVSLNIKVKGSNHVELPPYGGPRVASMYLCRSQLSATISVSDGPILDAEKFEIINTFFPPEDARLYSMWFRPHSMTATFKPPKKAGELDDFNFLTIWTKLIPLDGEIVSGEAVVIVNDTITREFAIPRQKAFAPLTLTNMPTYRDAFRVIATFGTNELPKNPGPQIQ